MDVKSCPRCKRTQSIETVSDISKMEICSYCAGMWCSSSNWVDDVHGTHQFIRKIAGVPSAEGSYGSVDDSAVFPESVTEKSVPEKSVNAISVSESRNLTCPDCQCDMLELSLGNHAIIDQCNQCGGIWLDHLEDRDLIALKGWANHQEEVEEDLSWGNWWFQFLSQLPVEFNIRPHRVPWVTILLIILCIATWLIQYKSSFSDWQGYAHIPVLFESGQHTWTPLTSMFMHADVFHLVANMYFLWLLVTILKMRSVIFSIYRSFWCVV